jgi:hypothetical protein
VAGAVAVAGAVFVAGGVVGVWACTVSQQVATANAVKAVIRLIARLLRAE